MSQEAREAARAQLKVLVERVLQEGKVEDAERDALRRVFAQAVLTVSDVKQVFAEYLVRLKNEVLADGTVTEAERDRCKNIVAELKIPLRLLPPELLDVVLGKRPAVPR